MHKGIVTSKTTLTFIIIALIFIRVSHAQGEHRRNGLWGGISAGIGYVESKLPESEESDSHFYLGFEGGYSVNPSFLVGVELSGWLYEVSNLEDPQEGEGLSQVFIITRYYPLKESEFFTKFGCGYTSHWSNQMGVTRREEGLGLEIGGGYDIVVGTNWSITPFISYSHSDVQHQSHNVFSLGIGITLH